MSVRNSRLFTLLAGVWLATCTSAMPQAGPSAQGYPSAPDSTPRTRKVLMIGDSLTVGPFGEAMEVYLAKKFGASRTYVYGSSGSSVQHWLKSTPNFVTKSGFREVRPGFRSVRSGAEDPGITPKVEDLIRSIKPDVIVVQLGTNHFTRFQQEGMGILDGQRRLFLDFARTLFVSDPGVRRVIWITPPDSSRFSPAIEDTVDRMIMEAAAKSGGRIGTVRSKPLIRYIPGETGSDGVHYSSEAAKAWAARVIEIMERPVR
jgi:lysophospholipase L1-like esterase